jgi:predicted transcriptional regulator
MSRQFNLRVSDEFAERLERLARRTGRSMAAVLEVVGTPALEAAEADAEFEDEAFVAYEAYQLTGVHVGPSEILAEFAQARRRAQTVADHRAE